MDLKNKRTCNTMIFQMSINIFTMERRYLLVGSQYHHLPFSNSSVPSGSHLNSPIPIPFRRSRFTFRSSERMISRVNIFCFCRSLHWTRQNLRLYVLINITTIICNNIFISLCFILSFVEQGHLSHLLSL